MIESSEAVDLILAIGVIPILIGAARTLKFSMKPTYIVAYGFVLVSYVATISEGFAAPVFFNLVEHACLAAAGITFAVAIRARYLELRAADGVSRP